MDGSSTANPSDSNEKEAEKEYLFHYYSMGTSFIYAAAAPENSIQSDLRATLIYTEFMYPKTKAFQRHQPYLFLQDTISEVEGAWNLYSNPITLANVKWSFIGTMGGGNAISIFN